MKLDWKKVPIELTCPECQVKIQDYEDLEKEDWRFLIPGSPEPLQDYHICPQCRRVWAITRPHTDEKTS